MKKFILNLSIFILIFLMMFFISRKLTQDYEIEFVDQLETTSTPVLVCVQRQDGKLVLVEVEKHKKEETLLYVLKLYDHYRNNLPLEYTTPLRGNFEVRSLTRTKDKVYIDLEALFLDSGVNSFLTSLMWSYQNLGINEIEIKINEHTFNLKKNEVINLELESTSLDNKTQIITYYNENEIIPVTYYHDEDPVDFLMKKVISKYGKIRYSYEIIDNNIILNIDDDQFIINETVVTLILNNLNNLGVFENIIIIKNDLVVANN